MIRSMVAQWIESAIEVSNDTTTTISPSQLLGPTDASRKMPSLAQDTVNRTHDYEDTTPSLGTGDELRTNGAACFGPHTALLGQDPLHWAKDISADTATRTIGSLQKGDTILAERLGQFFEAQIICVMTFEIPPVLDSVGNGATQEPTLSTELGFTLTRHHHIRNYGRLRLVKQGKWQLDAQEEIGRASCRERV